MFYCLLKKFSYEQIVLFYSIIKVMVLDMDNKRVGVIGHFGYGKNLVNGQTIKAKIITDELKKILGEEKVETLDSSIGIKGIISLFFRVGAMMYRCKNIIILPAHNGLVYFSIVLWFWNRFFNVRLHYIVIGGWLADFLKTRKWLSDILKKFSFIYAETTIMAQTLRNNGFVNVIYLPNCKSLKIKKVSKTPVIPYKVCTFSRVTKVKGIEDVINVVKKINQKHSTNIYKLDIYGPIDEVFISEFNGLLNDSSGVIKYKGVTDYENTSEILSRYDYLIFPSRYTGEGIPGTIIDAYASGLPVIFAKWQHWKDIMIDGKTGIGYEFCSVDGLLDVMEKVSEENLNYSYMQDCCIKMANNYQASKVVGRLVKNLL